MTAGIMMKDTAANSVLDFENALGRLVSNSNRNYYFSKALLGCLNLTFLYFLAMFVRETSEGMFSLDQCLILLFLISAIFSVEAITARWEIESGSTVLQHVNQLILGPSLGLTYDLSSGRLCMNREERKE